MRTTRFNMKDFGTRLRKLRQACGMTQEEFCDKIGISDTHYRKIEAGSRTGSLELIVEMAEYFHVSLDYLLLGETESNSKAKRDILAVIESLKPKLTALNHIRFNVGVLERDYFPDEEIIRQADHPER